MHKMLLLSISIYAILLLSCASNRTYIQGGFNNSDLSDGESLDQNSFTIGVSRETDHENSFGHGYQFSFSKRKAKLYNIIQVWGDERYRYDILVTQDFYEFSYLLKYSFKPFLNVAISPYFSPSLSFVEDQSQILQSEEVIPPPQDFDVEAIDDNWGPKIYGGVNTGFRFVYKPFFVDIRYFHGLSKLEFASGLVGFGQEWRTISVLFGYKFSF